MRSLFLALVVAVFTAAVPRALSHADNGGPVIASVSPRIQSAAVNRTLTVSGLAPNSTALVVLYDPAGNQTPLVETTDAQGVVTASLTAPAGGWAQGLWRIAVLLGNNRTVSATFAATDGQPHLYARPDLPSPTSAFEFDGVGLPPNSPLQLHLFLTGGQVGEHVISVTPDADGIFTAYVWPQQLGLTFFAAGDYRITAPLAGLETPFRVREHPVSSTPSVLAPVQPGGEAQIQLQSYPPNRYIFGVYAQMDGTVVGEFLLGPTDDGGRATGTVPMTSLAPGQYLLATPYAWGETAFTVAGPTYTATPTVTPTIAPTATDPPTLTPTPKPVSHKKHEGHKKKHKP